nr:MAG TPA: hypothetical protein [Caudoviricetes sp.]DAY16442.1 MAG TPA: hypothetical protein [Caudoviricetes sp.]
MRLKDKSDNHRSCGCLFYIKMHSHALDEKKLNPC